MHLRTLRIAIHNALLDLIKLALCVPSLLRHLREHLLQPRVLLMQAIHHGEVLLALIIVAEYTLFLFNRTALKREPLEEGRPCVIVCTGLRPRHCQGRG